jgi:hypothetical protein
VLVSMSPALLAVVSVSREEGRYTGGNALCKREIACRSQ